MIDVKHKNEKGITLIALTVTMIVLTILSTVTVNAIVGKGGMMEQAKQSRELYEAKEEAEGTKMEDLTNDLSQDRKSEVEVETIPAAGTVVEKPSNWTSSNVTPIADGSGGTVPLPSGFYYVGGDRDTGMVISDKKGDTLTSSGTTMGNQFVWIPISNEDDLTRTNFDSNGKPTTDAPSAGRDAKDCTEPYSSGYSTEAAEYNTMRTKVLQYGGFYIGRFEAGVNSTTLRTKVTTNQTVVCKKGVAPYNYVPWGKAMNDVDSTFVPTTNNTGNVSTNGAVYLVKNMYKTSNSVVATLTYGCQWDAMCRYIGDSGRKAVKKDTLQLTGMVSSDVSKNIYDLAGNCWELGMEEGGTIYRVSHGGVYYDGNSIISGRSFNEAPYTSYSGAFRPTLYIK